MAPTSGRRTLGDNAAAPIVDDSHMAGRQPSKAANGRTDNR
jgi:hypothetical protein